MIFETTSGTKYKLRNVEANATGYVGELVRLGDRPFHSLDVEVDMNDGEWAKVSFHHMPTIGESFQYWHERWMGCVSTPVKAFLKE